MLSLAKRLQTLPQCLGAATHHLRWFRNDAAGPPRRRRKTPALARKRAEDNSEWWIVDGEVHEIGENVPLRERFVLPRDNIPNKRRKQLREQFMRRTRLVIKESEHEPWCKRYLELYQELRENWERLYWDEGYTKKHGEDHANYESAEDDDDDFSPYRNRSSNPERLKERSFVVNKQDDTWEKVNLVRDKFEYDRERRMRDKAFAPMHGEATSDSHNSNRNQPFDAQRYFPQDERK
ncbi:hypothetical protein CsatB_024800 [Cannabis sativa]|uniref:Uncharacterized protein n=2 Tax=Cannabis sativa TaxID=3483 RepID=A0AB40E5Z9_CANSA|nr:uncharacterized protein LOC115714609 [Cannabis sativa]KAF4367552.1 hypothetical protein G4B88_003756 [Cannabis sativa]KAF4370340.1 hypothetical protein G4B88_013024 [Cannabis sativa]KAF4383164.1 hypothetical protein F8388_009195 [Cannabis sativa]